jgi:hypothetical protein
VGLGYIGCDFSFPCTSWVQGDIFMGGSPTAGGSQQSMFHEVRRRGWAGAWVHGSRVLTS